MKKNLNSYFTLGLLTFAVAASTAHAKDDDDKHKGKDKKHGKHHHADHDRNYSDRGVSVSHSGRSIIVRPLVRVESRSSDHRDYDRIDYRNDQRFNYRDSGRDVSYRTRYPRREVVYQDRSYGYNYYDMQVVLLREGYYDGPVDGIWGPASRRALTRYQSTQGWRDDGEVDGRFIVNFGIGY